MSPFMLYCVYMFYVNHGFPCFCACGTHLGVLLHWNSSGAHGDKQTSSEPSPQSSSLSHTHWEGMQRPPAQVNSVSKHAGEGGWQGTPSHCHKPSTQELHRVEDKNVDKIKDKNFIHFYTWKCLILPLTYQFWQCWAMMAPDGKTEPSHSHGHWGGSTQSSPEEQSSHWWYGRFTGHIQPVLALVHH